MKRILLLFVAIATVSLVGCSQDDEAYPTLKGTTWTARPQQSEQTDFVWVLAFPTETTATATLTSEILDEATTLMYDYIYNHPEVQFIGKGKAADLKGIVGQDGKMTVTNVSTQKLIGVFTKN